MTDTAREQMAEQARQRAERSRLGQLVIGDELLRQILHVPDDMEIVTMWSEPQVMGLRVLVRAPYLHKVAPGGEAPVLHREVYQSHLHIGPDDGLPEDKQGDWIRLEVRDNGVEAALQRLEDR